VTLAEKQARMIEDLLLIEDAQERLAAVVDRARKRAPLAELDRTDSNRVPGCISAAWVVGEVRAGLCHFRGDADSPLVRGLVILLCDLYSGMPPAEVLSGEPELLAKAGLARGLSPTRLNGLRSVRAKIRDFSLLHRAPEGLAPPG
jgi:cysteine desulfuration protein SufE